MKELTNGWCWATVGELGEYINGVAFKPTDWGGEGFPIIRIQNLTNPDKPLNRTKRLVDQVYRVEPGDLLVSWSATLDAFIWGREPSLLNQHIFKVVPNERVVQKRFLFYLLKLAIAEMTQSEHLHGSTMKHINRGPFLAHKILLPPLAEQKRIADKLDAVLARVNTCLDRLDCVSTLLKHLRQAILDAATSGKLTEDWQDDQSSIEAWRDVRLGEIVDIQGGVTKDTQKQSVGDEEVPYLRVANVQRGYFDLKEIMSIRVPANKLEKLLLEPGDILFNEGGDIDKVGRGWVWEGQIKRCTFQNHVFRARLFDKSNQPKYISWWGNYRGLNHFLRGGKQTTNLASINKSILSDLPISLPSSDEQVEIVRRVDAIFSFVNQIEARYTAARAQVERLTPSLLAKAFRGELVPQDPNDESANLLLERIKRSSADVKQQPNPTRLRNNKQRKDNRKVASMLIDALPKTGDWMTAQEAFRACGVNDGTKTESIEVVYAELRELERKRLVIVEAVRDLHGRKTHDRIKLLEGVYP